jgi:hypothetical protein
MKGASFADVAAIKERVTAVLRSIPKEAFADSFQKLYERCQQCVVKDDDYLKANKVHLFVSSVLFVSWYHSPNCLDTPRTYDVSDWKGKAVANTSCDIYRPFVFHHHSKQFKVRLNTNCNPLLSNCHRVRNVVTTQAVQNITEHTNNSQPMKKNLFESFPCLAFMYMDRFFNILEKFILIFNTHFYRTSPTCFGVLYIYIYSNPITCLESL